MNAVLDVDHGSIFALKHEHRQARTSCYCSIALEREIGETARMIDASDSQERRRRALETFYIANKAALESVNNWALKSGVAERTLGQFLDGSRKKNMRADTYEKLAIGASVLIDRKVTVYELMGEETATNKVESEFSKKLQKLTPALKAQLEAYLDGLLAAQAKSGD